MQSDITNDTNGTNKRSKKTLPNRLLKKSFSRLCEQSEAISQFIKSISSRLPRRKKRSSQ